VSEDRFEISADLALPGTCSLDFSSLLIDSNMSLDALGEDFYDEQMSAESRDREVTPDFLPSASPVSRAVSRGKFHCLLPKTV